MRAARAGFSGAQQLIPSSQSQASSVHIAKNPRDTDALNRKPVGASSSTPRTPRDMDAQSVRSATFPSMASSRASRRSDSLYPPGEEEPLIDTSVPAPQRTWSDHPSGGERTMLLLNPRGVASRFGSEDGFDLAMAAIIQYQFRNPDLLEEALESQNSGVVVVGKSHRLCLDGNRHLAFVGEAVMKLVLKDQCYLFLIPEGEA